MPFEQQIVVYGILSNVASEQPLRVLRRTATTSEPSRAGAQYECDGRARGRCRRFRRRFPGRHLPLFDCPQCVRLEPRAARSRTPVSPVRRGRGIQNVEAVTVVPREAVVTPGNVFAAREPSTYVSDFHGFDAPCRWRQRRRSSSSWWSTSTTARRLVAGPDEVPLRLVTTLGGGAAQHVYPTRPPAESQRRRRVGLPVHGV